jgi:hypothetical protein
VLAAVAVSVSVLVGGCTQDAGPKPSPLPSTTKSASPTSRAPTPPVMPAEAKGTSAKSAELFARQYVDLINYASQTGNTTALRAASTEECSTCKVVAAEIERPYKKGGHLEGGAWTTGDPSVGLASNRSNALISFPVRISKQTEFSTSNAATRSIPAASGTLDLRLIRRSSQWMVNRLDAKQS